MADNNNTYITPSKGTTSRAINYESFLTYLTQIISDNNSTGVFGANAEYFINQGYQYWADAKPDYDLVKEVLQNLVEQSGWFKDFDTSNYLTRPISIKNAATILRKVLIYFGAQKVEVDNFFDNLKIQNIDGESIDVNKISNPCSKNTIKSLIAIVFTNFKFKYVYSPYLGDLVQDATYRVCNNATTSVYMVGGGAGGPGGIAGRSAVTKHINITTAAFSGEDSYLEINNNKIFIASGGNALKDGFHDMSNKLSISGAHTGTATKIGFGEGKKVDDSYNLKAGMTIKAHKGAGGDGCGGVSASVTATSSVDEDFTSNDKRMKATKIHGDTSANRLWAGGGGAGGGKDFVIAAKYPISEVSKIYEANAYIGVSEGDASTRDVDYQQNDKEDPDHNAPNRVGSWFNGGNGGKHDNSKGGAGGTSAGAFGEAGTAKTTNFGKIPGYAYASGGGGGASGFVAGITEDNKPVLYLRAEKIE